MPLTVLRSGAAAAAIALTAALSACGGTSTDTAASVATSAAGAVSSAGSSAASAASTAASGAASAATSAASAAASSYTLAQVKEHASSSDCWAAIDGNVYNLTQWIGDHPGGPDKITALCGTDASAAFTQQHGNDATPKERLAGFKIGSVSS